MKQTLLLLVIFFTTLNSFAGKYWVEFKDKKIGNFNPYTYFDSKALERRTLNNYPLFHYSDWPVDSAYINELYDIVDSISHSSRWLNAVAVYADESMVEKLQSLHFVKTIRPFYKKKMSLAEIHNNVDIPMISPSDAWVLENQLQKFELNKLQEQNLNGNGVRIAVFDAGFKNVDNHPAFKHMFDNNRIIKTFDFVRKKENVYDYSSHGTSVLSNIGGRINKLKIGLATDATFLLARTERNLWEFFSEEENWVAAMEWADREGVDVINSSLGYTEKRYFTSDMTGEVALVSRVANMAFEKGIIVVNSAGNEGDSDWKFIGAPADAENVISVGGISPFTAARIDFSSYGPTANKKMKPNLVAYGYAIAAVPNLDKTIEGVYGTSFSGPLVAGFVACSKQKFPDMKAKELFEKIMCSGQLYPYYDYAHGYGIPLASKLLEVQNNNDNLTFYLEQSENGVIVQLNQAFLPEKELDNLTEFQKNNYKQLLFYHFENEEGYLSNYRVIVLDSQKNVLIPNSQLIENTKLRVHYQGSTLELDL